MRLTIFYVGIFPIHVWLGFFLAFLVLLQMSIGKRIVKVNFDLWHRKIIPITILIVLILHAWYGLSIYWPR